MINPEPSIKSQNKAQEENAGPRRDFLSPMIAVGGVLSTIAAQRVGEPVVRIVSTVTGLLAATLGSSAYVVGRRAEVAEQTLAKMTAQGTVLQLPHDEPANDLTVIVDLEKQSVPALIDLNAGAEQLSER